MRIANEYISRHRLMNRLPPTVRDVLASAGSTVTYQRGESVWHRGERADGFSLVADGIVAEFVAGVTERALLVSLSVPGDALDLSCAIRAGRREREAVAFTDEARVIKVPRERWWSAMQASPEAMRTLCEVMAEESDRLAQRVALCAAAAPVRLAHFLLLLGATAGTREGGAVRVPLRLTREHLAQYIGTTPETVSRTLLTWRESGVLSRERDGFVIRDLDALTSITRADADAGVDPRSGGGWLS